MGRKHRGKRRNCSLRAISPFSSVLKTLLMQTPKNKGLFGQELIQEKKMALCLKEMFPFEIFIIKSQAVAKGTLKHPRGALY